MRGSASTARWVFAGSVLLLALNDWCLKGAGLLPGWVTGKLSDVAGMLVAPVVLAALLARARVPVAAARVLGALTVALGFAALKLSAPAAAAFDGAVNGATRALALPLAARTATDPTDLLVLALLPLGGWAAERLALDRPVARSGALFVGLLACAATSPAYERLEPHWVFQDPRLDRMWGERLTNGAVVVQFGRQSDDGSFELGLELTGREGALSLDTADVALEMPGERVLAAVPPGEQAQTSVGAGETKKVRLVFSPRTPKWPKGTKGALDLVVGDGERRRAIHVPLSFDERIAPWGMRPALY